MLLDEPTVGLDPQVRQELWSLIDGLRMSGVTVLMSTHYIEEAERLADIVAVMSAGRIVALGTPAELVRAHAGEEVLEVYGPPEQLAEAASSRARKGWAEPPQRPGARDHARRVPRRGGAGGRAAPGQPRGRVRGVDRRGDRMSASAARAARREPVAAAASTGSSRRRSRA